MTSLLPWMTTVGQMTEQQLINLKLELARAWLQNGQEDMARSLIKSIIEKDEDANVQSIWAEVPGLLD